MNELNMDMNNILKHNLLCVILVFNSIYFVLSSHGQLVDLHRFLSSECETIL